jgi:hypothetical protein
VDDDGHSFILAAEFGDAIHPVPMGQVQVEQEHLWHLLRIAVEFIHMGSRSDDPDLCIIPEIIDKRLSDHPVIFYNA